MLLAYQVKSKKTDKLLVSREFTGANAKKIVKITRADNTPIPFGESSSVAFSFIDDVKKLLGDGFLAMRYLIEAPILLADGCVMVVSENSRYENGIPISEEHLT